MNASSSAVRGVARHPVLAFMVISLGVGFVTAAIPPIVDSKFRSARRCKDGERVLASPSARSWSPPRWRGAPA